MSRSHIIQNIIQSLFTISSDEPIINVLYEDTDSIFDIAIKQSKNLSIFFRSNNMPYLSYDLYWSNEPTHYISSVGDIQSQHIHDIIYFRNMSESNVKKEDKFLIQNRFGSSFQIARNQHIQADWHMNKHSTTLEYGIPNTNLDKNANRDGSIIVLNTHGNKSLEQLYYTIKQNWPDTYMLTDIKNHNYSQICDIVQKYRICIETQDTYNVLFGMANGCRVVSTINHDNEDICTVSSFDNIIQTIKLELDNYNNYPSFENSQHILNKYSFDKFEQSLFHIIRNILSTSVVI